jgi:hypothetical protein
MDFHPDSQESAAMVEIECPWCAAAAELVAGEPAVGRPDALECAACGVRVEVAGGPIVREIARAA